MRIRLRISRYRDSQSAYLHSINRGGRTSEQLGGGGGGGGGRGRGDEANMQNTPH